MRVTLLGTGTSTGVPIIGCSCRVCTSADPRDRRTRCACHIGVEGLSLIIDTGPDFRQQALREGITHVDAVLYTHHHFDHVAGLGDLRPFCFYHKTPIPCYARVNTAEVMAHRFAYVFQDGTYPGIPRLDLHVVEAPFEVRSRIADQATVEVIPIAVFHGDLPIFGYRIGRFAYLTDASRIPAASYPLLEDLDVLVLDALRREPHPTHYAIDEAVAEAQRIGARATYFIHMTHSVCHAEDDARLPAGIHLGYDGLSFDVAC